MKTEVAYIRDLDCIGCTKCLDVCPTDAIVGASKFLHSVIAEDCIGCQLCLPACPVDCIDMIPSTQPVSKSHSQPLIQRRKARLQQQAEAQKSSFLALKAKLKATS